MGERASCGSRALAHTNHGVRARHALTLKLDHPSGTGQSDQSGRTRRSARFLVAATSSNYAAAPVTIVSTQRRERAMAWSKASRVFASMISCGKYFKSGPKFLSVHDQTANLFGHHLS
ncbi:hypothetical protein [Methylocella silvestris]|uniref:hypothetical protein n=1 Tax=Methylocella silvestris TaxID=199596 RepID=UPI00164FD75A|nr:hypothetical protein [Methylocella silvestris]